MRRWEFLLLSECKIIYIELYFSFFTIIIIFSPPLCNGIVIILNLLATLTLYPIVIIAVAMLAILCFLHLPISTLSFYLQFFWTLAWLFKYGYLSIFILDSTTLVSSGS